MSGRRLTTFPKSLTSLSDVEDINLSRNKLTALPDFIAELGTVQYLNLSHNRLQAVPEAIGEINRLRVLALSHNRLGSLPTSIVNLRDLHTLRLDYNNLPELPDSLTALPSIRELYLHGNEALRIPAEVLGPTWQSVKYSKATPARAADILGYYFQTRTGKRALNEAKLILVGRGNVGKTSIVNRLIHNRFNQRQPKTDGIKISEWQLRLLDTDEIRLNVWDFGGQEILHATHQFFLTKRSLYLLVLSGRDGAEDADAEYWLKLIESFGEGSPVIMVLNKINEQSFELNRRALQQKYPFIRAFQTTDCKDGTGIKELRDTIQRETDRLEHLRDAFPTSWFEIKAHLARMRKNYLTFSQYRKLCSKYGEKNDTAQERLASYLHNLGVALNYRDDPRLQDTHILSPHWVTNGIYRVLNSETLRRQKGEITLSDLGGILDQRSYPTNMHRFLMDMMKKFDLCFEFTHDNTRYLIPELLNKEESVATSEFDPKACLNFEYRYSVLPEGLLPRFIVRTHSLSAELPHWRTGVVLQFEENRALVKADVQDKKVFINVAGNPSSRRRLLAVIRSDFTRIHSEIRNLRPLSLVPLPEYVDVAVPYEELCVMEQHGKTTLSKVIAGDIVEFDVRELLDGVDLEHSRSKAPLTDKDQRALRVFFSYSHKDESLRDELETHLKILQRRGLIETWHDRKIEAGDLWREEIDENLARAQIILLLVSADFIASDYCYETEMTEAIGRHLKGDATVIPIILRDVNWMKTPFSNLLALPKDGVPVSKWSDRDSAWRNVSDGIERVVNKIAAHG